MAPGHKAKVYVDEDGKVHVDTGLERHDAPEDLVAEKREDEVATFGDDTFKTNQHIRFGL